MPGMEGAAMGFHLRVMFAILLCAVIAPPSAYCRTRTKWVRCAMAEGRFSVRLPGRAVRSTRPIEGPDKRASRMITVTAEDAKASYLAAYADYGSASRSLSPLALQTKICRGVLKVARAGLVRQRPIAYRGRSGIEVRALRDPLVDENESPYVHVRCFVVGTRVYVLLQAGTLREPNLRFFNSLRLSRRVGVRFKGGR